MTSRYALRFSGLALVLFIGLCTAPTVSAAEIWSINEWALRFPEAQNRWQDYLPRGFKVQTENQFSDVGYQQFLLRVGPTWQVSPWLDLSAFSSVVHARGTEKLYKELRWEFEPTLKGRMGDHHWSNRNRLAYRMFADGSGWRYRNRTQWVYSLDSAAVWSLFASDEIFLSPDQGFAQNRWLLGIGQQLNTAYAWRLAWQNRWFKAKDSSADWVNENGLVFSLTML